MQRGRFVQAALSGCRLDTRLSLLPNAEINLFPRHETAILQSKVLAVSPSRRPIPSQIQSIDEHLIAILISSCGKFFRWALCTLLAFPAFGQKPVEISIPDGCSGLLTGGGEGKDDAPAPFLPAVATIRNLSNNATVRIMDGTNTNQLPFFGQVLASTPQEKQDQDDSCVAQH